jgi:site-specific DNA-methyltransferase (adenine-specific)
MKTLPNKSVDLFLCDLPYGCLTANRSAKRVGELPDKSNPNSNIVIVNKPIEWDIKIDLPQFWTQVKRLCKNDHTPVLMFCSTKFGVDLINSNPDWFRYDVVWQKTNAVGFLSANKQPMRSHEMIYVFAKKGATYIRKDLEGDFPAGGGGTTKSNVFNSVLPNLKTTREGFRCVKSVFTFANKKGKGKHPTQKPADLYEFLIERYSKEGDTVLDPTAGSFASGVACKQLNRSYIGIEMNTTFYEKGLALLQ